MARDRGLLRSANTAQPIEIRAGHLHKAFGDHVVLRDVSLDVRRGQIVALVGASGSGKTVLLDILTGLIPADSGAICVADHNTPGSPLVDLSTLDGDALDGIRMHWSVVFQRNALFSGTVFDNIALWFREHTDMREEEVARRVRESLEAASLDVEDVINKGRDELSGGMAKRVAIARAIAVDPAVIFYDEPTTGLDPVLGGRIQELIFELHNRPVRGDAAERLRTSVVVTHDKELLRRVRPRVVMLHDAGVCFDGPYEEFGTSSCPPAQEYLRAMPVLHARADQRVNG
jgi:phospholipid/cholesterol/gamma-HCH transport system ATP-binding protein